MSRMGSVSSPRFHFDWVLVFMALVVNCVLVHALVQDMALLTHQSTALATGMDYDEMNHQDDLAVQMMRLDRLDNSFEVMVQPVTLIRQETVELPHFEPPKI